MADDIVVQEGIVIPAHELEFTASTAGGPGGQHVNRSNTRITVRWNVIRTAVLNDVQKEQVLHHLDHHLNHEGDLIVHAGKFRGQDMNKDMACKRLAELVRKALYVPKKRIATRPTPAARKARMDKKTVHSNLKKLRTEKINPE
jgi:ribosome-associated protein